LAESTYRRAQNWIGLSGTPWGEAATRPERASVMKEAAYMIRERIGLVW
jgi:hypothetical protein